MQAHLKRKLVAGVVTVAAVAGGGAAIAATQDTSPTATSSAIVSDAASQLGIQSSTLTAALKKAEENQIDAQVTAGTLTQTQADALKAKIDAGTVPLVGVGGPGFGHRGGPGGLGGPGGPGGNLDAAATYLGVTSAVLKTDLQGGQTLAQVATAQGKTVDGLVSALVTAAKSDLDAQVTAGNLTAAQETSIESDLTAHITDMVNGVRPAGGPGAGSGLQNGLRRSF